MCNVWSDSSGMTEVTVPVENIAGLSPKRVLVDLSKQRLA